MNPRQSICLFFLVTVVVCTLAGSSPAGTIKLRKLRSRSSDSSRVSIASKQLSSGNSNSSSSEAVAFDVTRALIKTAKALARSHSTSEVLTLNLTNLLILVVLKAIIFGIGLFYFGGISFRGHEGGHGWGSGHGRSLVEKNKPFMSQGELLLIMTYILGVAEKDNYDCMYRVACEDPKQAKDYLNASKMILKGVKYAKKFISYNPKYEDIVRGLQDAVAHKANGGDCKARYVCRDVPNL